MSQVQKPRTGREKMPRPMTPKLRPQKATAPVARENGEEIVHGAETPINNAAQASQILKRGKPGTPRLKALKFGAGPANPFNR